LKKLLLDDKLIYVDTYAKIESVMDAYKDKNVRVAYSGGSDSDAVMWLLRSMGYDIPAVIYNTGIEYAATWEHVDYMKSQGFTIETIKAEIPVPSALIKFGQPFISKNVSNMLVRLQRNNFDFIKDGNKTADELLELYPRARWAIGWWTNINTSRSNKISWNSGLKEFLSTYGLPFKISDKCCDGAKKLPMKTYAKANNIDLLLMGIRKAEGGRRSTMYTSCFIEPKQHSYAMFLPVFWWNKENKDEYIKAANIQLSRCYTEYGLNRTGCPGCPFGRGFEDELVAIDTYEPKLSKGVRHIFKNSYEWTRKYREFVIENKIHIL